MSDVRLARQDNQILSKTKEKKNKEKHFFLFLSKIYYEIFFPFLSDEKIHLNLDILY